MEMNSEIAYARCKCGAVVTEVLCFSGSNQWTAHSKQQHALTYTSTFWYVLKVFLLHAANIMRFPDSLRRPAIDLPANANNFG